MKWKTGLIKCLIHRANRICSSKPLLRKEIDHLRSMFYRNGYPKRLFDQIVEEYWEKQDAKTPDPVDQKPIIDETIKPILKIPYIGSNSVAFSNRIKKLVKSEMNLEVQTVYETARIKDQFRLKDAVEKEILSNVVYRFSCSSDSRIQYIGYTNRTLRERVKEHLGGTTAISDHIGTCEGCKQSVSIDNFEVIKKCRNWGDTPVYEAMLIQRHNPTINRQLTTTQQFHTFNLRVFN